MAYLEAVFWLLPVRTKENHQTAVRSHSETRFDPGLPESKHIDHGGHWCLQSICPSVPPFTVLHRGHLYPHFNGWDIFFPYCPVSAVSNASFKEIAITYGYHSTRQWWWEFTAPQKWHE